MEAVIEGAPARAESKKLNLFERYLTFWVAGCMVAGILIERLCLTSFRPSVVWNSVKVATSISPLPC